ncbi:MAG TPA: pyruvate, phosphate dikinase [Clostridiaceae bacterium]|nr:pyruvate, phosphate dikinase [Clostridiaceae bacterium]
MNEDRSGEYLLDVLKEREKELNCLYLVEEYLNNRRLSLPEVFEGIIKTIPSGYQFPEFCEARIVYGNTCYQTPGFRNTPIMDSSNIKVDEKVVGKLQVVYTRDVPQSQEGYFLDKERRLIKTIADRIGQTILYRQMEQIRREWESARQELHNGTGSSEWRIIIDLFCRTDKEMLLHICRKMINYLSWSGVKEAMDILHSLGAGGREYFEQEDQNFPTVKRPIEKIEDICKKTFDLASKHLSDNEISIHLRKWIQEERAYFLIKAIDSIDAPMKGIVEAITRYRNMAENNDIFYAPTERWLRTALVGRFFSDNLNFINTARQYVDISDFYDIVNRIIYPVGSSGKLGGKSAGLFLAYQILRKESENNPLLEGVKVPKTWYITTDTLKDFLHYNNLEELNEQKYKELYEVRIEYPNIVHLMKNSHFPPEIIKSLSMALDDFGEVPLIVRSSSLLEDQMGSSFSGKYKSLFIANQGSKQERLEALMDAVTEVYASVFSPDSIQYRAERGLLDFPEEMGIMIQEVVGTRVGRYYFPVFAGVAFSNNEFRWSPRIKREDGLIRMVPGLGTRAVDRLSDDFPVLISPGQPGLRVNTSVDEIRRYSPKKIDVINLETNSFETVEISSVLKEYGDYIPNIHKVVSICRHNHIEKPLAFGIDFQKDDVVVTFEGFLSDTRFIKQMDAVMKTLKEKLGTPVDVEFAFDGNNLFLLQCRPQSFSLDCTPSPIPQDISQKDIIFSANRYVSNGRVPDISYIVYVDPAAYDELQELDDIINAGRIVGLLNSILPKRQFILMGPGRWGSRGDIKMGVQVSYADINNTAALIEIARNKSGYVPELSFGTHFFQDLVESNIRYLPIYPDDKGIIFNEAFLTKSDNILAELLPKYEKYSNLVHVIDVPKVSGGRILKILTNADLEKAVAFLASPAEMETELKKPEKYTDARPDDRFWRWRHYMAERIAESIDMARFGVEGIYLFGSTNNASAGPGSDIDLLIHFTGSPEQRKELLLWLEGWSLCLSEINYLKTGYTTSGLLDVHIVTDGDIKRRTCFATKINAVTDPAHPLRVREKDSN